MATGTRTPNMSIYKPAVGEQVYDPAFAAGLDKIDSHDHSGAKDKGVLIGTSGIEDGAITPAKLSEEIISEVTVQTTNGVATEAVSIPVALSTSVTVTGRFVGLTKTSAAKAVGGEFAGSFYRTNASSITQVGVSLVSTNENYAATPTVALTLVADTGNQAVSIRVTGVAATAIDWHLAYNVLKQPE